MTFMVPDLLIRSGICEPPPISTASKNSAKLLMSIRFLKRSPNTDNGTEQSTDHYCYPHARTLRYILQGPTTPICRLMRGQVSASLLQERTCASQLRMPHIVGFSMRLLPMAQIWYLPGILTAGK